MPDHQYTFVILGAGRQGTAAAVDLALRGGAARILLYDADPAQAERAAARVDALAGRAVAEAAALDVRDHAAVVSALRGADAALSAVPYRFNLPITHAAIEAGTHLCDMGGNTAIVREQLALADEAAAAGVSLLPDCGMGPGLVNVIAVRAMDLLDAPRAVLVADAGLPQDPQPPWNYALTFNINGLTNEYDGTVAQLRGGEMVRIEALSHPRDITLPGLGTFESFIAEGGSTAAWTFEGMLEHFETRIMRYPGHYAAFRAFKELGLFGEEPVVVGEQSVVPRELYHALLAPQIVRPGIRDMCIMHAEAVGEKDGEAHVAAVDVHDRYDEATGLTGMERLTGWHCAVMMGYQVAGVVPPGARPLEALMLDGQPTAADVLDAMQARGISVSEGVRRVGDGEPPLVGAVRSAQAGVE